MPYLGCLIATLHTAIDCFFVQCVFDFLQRQELFTKIIGWFQQKYISNNL